MAYLITVEEFAANRDISKKIDNSKVTEAIGLAQQSDLMEILGDFYFDVVKNAADPYWSDLLEGSDFEYLGDTYQHAGIKKMLSDYTYARYMYIINVNLTPFGAQKKHTQDSEAIDRNTVRDLTKVAQQDAGNKFKYIEYYIMSEPELFSRYCKNKGSNTSFFSNKISKL